MRVLYLQYTSPGNYPPLLHSARLFADRGWAVRYFGVRYPETAALTTPFPGRLWKAGGRAKALLFQPRALLEAIRWRPDLVYVSNPHAAPVGLALRRLGFRVLYHEHDPPVPGSLPPAVAAARRALGRSAALVVLPQAERLEAFLRETSRSLPSFVVWNGPLDVPELGASPAGPLRLIYHGSLGADRLPLTVLEAMAVLPSSSLEVRAYETADYGARFRARARELGVPVTFHPPLPHAEAVARLSGFHVGLALTTQPRMAGAANKVFEYLAHGLLALVPDTAEWAPFPVLRADPTSPHSIAEALRRFPQETLRRTAWEKCRAEWSYAAQFAPVLAAIS